MTRGRSIVTLRALRQVLVEELHMPQLFFFPWNPEFASGSRHGWTAQRWATRWVDVLSYRPDRHGD